MGGVHRAVGTIPIGTIFSLAAAADDRRKTIVEAWLPRRIGAVRHVGPCYADTFIARGGHLAEVRDLATGWRFLLADHFILSALKSV